MALDIVVAAVKTAKHEAKQERKRRLRAQARGAQKARLEREEKQASERKEEHRRRQERAATVAQELIREVGIGTVKKVFDALKGDYLVHHAIAEILAADDGLDIPPYLDRRGQS